METFGDKGEILYSGWTSVGSNGLKGTNKGDSRPRHLQGKRAYTGWLDKLGFFSLFGPM